MELEVKHLAPYLPYGLKLVFENFPLHSKECPHVRILELDCGHDFNLYLQRGHIKPILQPLSKLSNEDLIPIGLLIRDIEKQKATYKDNIFAVEDAKAWIRTGMKPVLSLLQAQRIMEHLYSIHADIFGLIPAGLAIDINTLNK
jgi:hypothetical protein